MNAPDLAFLAIVVLSLKIEGSLGEYYGIFIGDIKGFRGKVYAANDKQVYITEMHLGLDRKAYFCIGKSESPSSMATKIPDEYGNEGGLREYADARVLLTLPSKITDYTFIGVCTEECKWRYKSCRREFKTHGYVGIPPGLELPVEQKIGPLAGAENHANATEVILKDSATIQLKKLNYDGQVLDAYFAVDPRGGAQRSDVTILNDENGTNNTLKAYWNKDVTLLLPEGHHWNEYQSFMLYSFEAGASFAYVNISRNVAGRLPVHRPTTHAAVVPRKHDLLGDLVVVIVFAPVMVCLGNVLIINPLQPYPPASPPQ